MFEPKNFKTLKVETLEELREYSLSMKISHSWKEVNNYANSSNKVTCTLDLSQKPYIFSSSVKFDLVKFGNIHLRKTGSKIDSIFSAQNQFVFSNKVNFRIWIGLDFIDLRLVLEIPESKSSIESTIKLNYNEIGYQILKDIFGNYFELANHKVILA